MSSFSKSLAAFLVAAYRSLHSRTTCRILCLQHLSGHWVTCTLSPSAVFTSSAVSHDHPSRLSTLSALATKPSVPGLILLFCMASHACLHSGIHESLLLSIVFNVAKVWYAPTCTGSILCPSTRTASTISFDLVVAPVSHRVPMICDVSPPWGCSLGIPHSIANWYLGIAPVPMRRARSSNPNPLGKRAILARVHAASSVLLFLFVLSLLPLYVTGYPICFSKLMIFIPNCSAVRRTSFSTCLVGVVQVDFSGLNFVSVALSKSLVRASLYDAVRASPRGSQRTRNLVESLEVCNEVQHRLPDSLIQSHSTENLLSKYFSESFGAVAIPSSVSSFVMAYIFSRSGPTAFCTLAPGIPPCTVLWSHACFAHVIVSPHRVLDHAQCGCDRDGAHICGSW